MGVCSATIGVNVALQGKTILVVEDDALIGILLTDFLSAGGAIVLGPVTKRLTENELSDFSQLWHDGCVEAIIEAQNVDRNHSTKV